jgi:D-alanine transaminase
MPAIAYVNGEFLPLAEARISVLDRGFIFADGVYEVSAVIDGGLVDHAAHMARLRRSLKEIGLSCPVPMEELTGLQLELLTRNALEQGTLYLQITRGAAERDFRFPDGGVTPSLVMFTQARDLVGAPEAARGIAVKSVPDLRWKRRDIKSVALLAQVLAKQEAVSAGCQEAWMVENGFVTEGASSSAFIISQDGVLVARPVSNEILPGITRISVLQLAGEQGLRIEDRPFTIGEALNAAEAFNCSAGGLVMPVVRIDGKKIAEGKPGPVTSRLRELYIAQARASILHPSRRNLGQSAY